MIDTTGPKISSLATLMFGFKFDGGSVAAGVVATAFAFGLTLLALAYVLGPISGCHVNPAVTLGALVARAIGLNIDSRLVDEPACQLGQTVAAALVSGCNHRMHVGI